MSETEAYDMEAFLNEMEGQIDNWDSAKESANSSGPKEFKQVSVGEHAAKFKGDIRLGKDKNGNAWMAIPFTVTEGIDTGLSDSFFLSFNPEKANDQGVMWGEVNMLRILSGLKMDLDSITSRREAMEVIKGLLTAEAGFTLRVRERKNGTGVDYYTAGLLEDDQDTGPQVGQEVSFKFGKMSGKGVLEKDNGDGTYAVRSGNKLHPKVTITA